MTDTAATLNLIKTIAALDFRAMTDNDFAAFADAQADSQIAFAGADLADAVYRAFDDPISMDEGNNIAVIISGDHIELCALTPDGDAASYSIDLGRL